MKKQLRQTGGLTNEEKTYGSDFSSEYGSINGSSGSVLC